MSPQTRRSMASFFLIVGPILAWLAMAMYMSGTPVVGLRWHLIFRWAFITRDYPVLWGTLAAAFAVGLLATIWINRTYRTDGFEGAGFKRFIRGTRVVSARRLARSCRQRRRRQLNVAGIPMPAKVENLHLLVAGATGTGKSVLMRNLIYSALRRGDRALIVDPNGDMLSKFYRPGDIILNPYDSRTEGWVFFNDVRADYDWKRIARSVVPMAQDKNSEEWNEYGRLLLRETAKKLHSAGATGIQDVFNWCTIADDKDLRKFLTGTLAESLFAGSAEASKALTSARFVLSNKLSEHMSMPAGGFSIRDWMADPRGGNLFINWREDMAAAMKPLVSCWVDVFLQELLSMPASRTRKWALSLDELASLDALSSLVDGLTKGRKSGGMIFAGLQSTAQLDYIYGRTMSQIIRASFRNLVVLGGSKTDAQTAEDLSKALGEHEVERPDYSVSHSSSGRSMSDKVVRVRERVVLPSEIQEFPELTGYVSFAGRYPIAKVALSYQAYRETTPSFVESTQLAPLAPNLASIHPAP
ncbi:type IV secretion system DNA-binding domain-containing protein [Castellaniella sp. UC4442_H9]